MLQMRAGRCPGCKEEAPPGAEYCPICGEYLGWQTTSGKNISRDKPRAQNRRSGQNLVRTLIVLLAAYLISLLGFHFFNSPSNSITEMPPLQSTPASVANDTTTNNATGNTIDATGLTDNSVVDNSVTNNSASASTPAATATPNADNALPDFDLQ